MPEHVERDLFALAVGKRLGVPAAAVWEQPPRLLDAAVIQMLREDREHQLAMAKAERARKARATRR